MEACVKAYHNRYKGLGARKLYKAISKCFAGVSERDVLSVNAQSSTIEAHLLNKVPLRPVLSSGVMNQVQIDRVGMKNNK